MSEIPRRLQRQKVGSSINTNMTSFNFDKFRNAIAPLTSRMAGFAPTVTVPVKVDLSTIDGEDAWAWARCWTRCRALHGRADLSRKMDSTYAEARFEDYRDAVAFKLSMPEEWL